MLFLSKVFIKKHSSSQTFFNKTYCTYVDIQKFNIKYLVMYKVDTYGCNKLVRVWFVRLYGW